MASQPFTIRALRAANGFLLLFPSRITQEFLIGRAIVSGVRGNRFPEAMSGETDG